MLATPAFASEAAHPSPEQIALNDAARVLGEVLFRNDLAGFNASQVLTDALDLSRYPEVRGYFTQEMADGWVSVVFYAVDEGAYFAFAEFMFDGTKITEAKVHSDYREHPLADMRLRLAAAREAALAQGAKEALPLCMSTSANFVTVFDPVADLVSVYILSAPATPGRYPVGGHYRFDVDASGLVVGGRAFADRCFDVPVINAHTTFAPENFSFVHMMDPQPNAIQHFVARQMNLQMVVTAGNVDWRLDYRVTASERAAVAVSK